MDDEGLAVAHYDDGSERVDELLARVRAHWAERGDLTKIQALLKRRGLLTEDLAPDDLAVLDQLHAGQLESTRMLVEWAGIESGQRVLDVGAGLGGTARYLAWELGCEVTALELAPELDVAGRELTHWLGLEELVTHRCGDLGELEVDERRYDVVLLQHVDMHLPDKVAAYGRCREALDQQTSARVLWHDWLAGPGGAIRLPVPWSGEDEQITFLSTQDELRRNLVCAGLALHRFSPLQAETAVWFSTSRDQIQRVLGKSGVEGRAGLLHLLSEVEGALINLAEQRLIPFFGEARRVE